MNLAATIQGWRNALSLRQQMAAVTAVLCLALVLCSVIVATDIARRQATDRIEGSMVSLASSMALRLESYMDERFRDVRDVATLPGLGDAWKADPDSVRDTLAHMQGSMPDFTWLGYVGTNGNVIAASKGMLEGVSVAERPWFQAGRRGANVQDVHDAKLLSDLLGPNGSGEPFRFVDIAVPVKGAGGATEAVLGAHLSWEWATRLRDEMMALVDPATRTSIWILRSDGRVLLGPEYDSQPLPEADLARVNAGEALTFVDDTGEQILAAVVRTTAGRTTDLGWLVVARRPLAVAMADVNQMTLAIAGVGLLLAGLGICGAWLVSARLTRPLDELTDEVDQIGRDSKSTITSHLGGSSDVRRLSTAIRSLLRRVGSAEDARHQAEREIDSIQAKMDERARTLGEHINTLQELADTDPLTHLLNRRAFLVFAADAMNYFRRYDRDICVLVVDIDYFKRVNDSYGHGVGDDVIEFVGRTIQGEVRTTDKVARFGGEEFVVLLRETDLDNATMLADRIRCRIGDSLIDSRGHTGVNVTASIGLAMAQRDDRDISDVIERADRALYIAKTTGRNRVISHVEQQISDAA
jgi:diguanylate cyclase (GGDEF)-like protein